MEESLKYSVSEDDHLAYEELRVEERLEHGQEELGHDQGSPDPAQDVRTSGIVRLTIHVLQVLIKSLIDVKAWSFL